MIPMRPLCAASSLRLIVPVDKSPIALNLPTKLTDCASTLARLDSSEGGIDGRVIVPSRCYYEPSPSRPLNGMRVAVKDNIDIQGHKTTLNNRAWRDLYPPASKHAHCVQLLIDAGAIIVGKVKLQAMIVREEPVEATEFANPFNPRGDGYQVPSGSSSGSAAAIGSYDWLDLSLGSDSRWLLCHYLPIFLNR